MLPVFTLGGFDVYTFPLAMAVGFLAAALLGRSQARRIGVDPGIVWDLLPFALVGGLAGAKLLSAAIHPGLYRADPMLFFSPGSGLVWYGGLAGGVAAVLWRARTWGIGPLTVLAGAAAPVALGHAIGRIGCFLTGDDYGRPTDAWVGVAFPEGAPPTTAAELRRAGASIPEAVPDAAVLAVHPTQLYEFAALLLIAAVTWRLWRRGASVARICAAYAASYGLVRFVLEFVRLKDDHLPVGLTVSQVVSLALIGAALVLWRLPVPVVSPARPSRAALQGGTK